MIKNKTLKRITAAMLMLLVLAICVFADDITVTYDGVAFSAVSEDGALVITGILGENLPDTVVFPSEFDGMYVSQICNVKFGVGSDTYLPFDLRGVKKIVIPEGVKLSPSNFIGVENLEEVELPASVESIPAYGFAGAEKLQSINLENVKRVSSYAFINCTSLTQVNLSSAERIVENAFDGVENLTVYGVSGSAAEKFAKEKGFTFIAADKPEDPNAALFRTCTDANGALFIAEILGKKVRDPLTIPAVINGTPVKGIGDFRDGSYQPVDLRGIKHLVIDNGIESISCRLTGTENLETVKFPGSLTSLADSAFAGAAKLGAINLNKVVSIGNAAFDGCVSLTRADLSSAEQIGTDVFPVSEDLFIYGKLDSAAARYATENGLVFYAKSDTGKNPARCLNKLGLMKGVGTDENGNVLLDTGREPTRAEAVVMLIRLLGAENEALSHEKTHPFTDVPEWADGYISYAYENGLTEGVSDTLFAAEDPASPEMYLTFLLRALGYTDRGEDADFSWENPWEFALERGLTERDKNYGQLFSRFEMADMSFCALFAEMKGTQTKLYKHLIADGVFTFEDFKNMLLVV